MNTAQLWILGTPLTEKDSVSSAFLDRLEACAVLVAETRKVALRWCSKRRELEKKTWFFLDGMKTPDWKDCTEQLRACAKAGTDAALFSDGGMPILFDPGVEVLSFCRQQGFRIRTQAGATSWATACALSGWDAPFYIQGFLPRKTEERAPALEKLRKCRESVVLMETPYRFESLLEQVATVFPGERAVFLAWEIGSEQENYLWSTVGKIQSLSQKLGLQKGEFVLILGPN